MTSQMHCINVPVQPTSLKVDSEYSIRKQSELCIDKGNMKMRDVGCLERGKCDYLAFYTPAQRRDDMDDWHHLGA